MNHRPTYFSEPIKHDRRTYWTVFEVSREGNEKAVRIAVADFPSPTVAAGYCRRLNRAVRGPVPDGFESIETDD